MNKGYYIVIEGPEGVGKTTQIELLAHAFQKYNYPVRIFREPDSQSHVSARVIRKLTQDPQYPLNTRAEVLLYNAARALSLDVIKQAREQGLICLVDRNYLTTLAIQFYGRGDVPDYNKINEIISFAVADMEPDLTIVLDASVDELAARLNNRASGERFDALDTQFLDRVRAGYLLEAKKRNYPVVYANAPKEDVFMHIWQHIAAMMKSSNKDLPRKYLPASHTVDSTSAPVEKNNPNELDTIVTDTKGNVYAFTGEMNQVTVAAAMARLSRRGDDMRTTLVEEFIGKEGKDEDLIKRVVTAYGDDSVQQLVGMHIVVEGASNILTKKLEWGRLAAYLEQSTRYIYYDKKDSNGRYAFYIPSSFKGKYRKQYEQSMHRIFDIYSDIVRSLTSYLEKHDTTPQKERDAAWRSAIRAQACDAARPLLPVATKSTVGIYASGQALESLIMHLLADELPEARETGQKILQESRKISPAFLERADKPDRGGATIAYLASTKANVKSIADELLRTQYSVSDSAVTLTQHWPINELDIVPYMLYEHTDISESELKREVAKLSFKDKERIFSTYVGERLNRRHKPGRAFERAWYSWDILCDYGIFRDLQRHRMVNDMAWQELTPRYGYDVPELIENAGLTDAFLEAFDLSLQLHSTLQPKYGLEAQYAVLLGHNMRWKVTMNAREMMHFIELRTSPQGHPGYRKLVKEMYDILSEVHPLIANAMRFVNKDEDPQLSRLAAEKYTQYKLSVLENN